MGERWERETLWEQRWEDKRDIVENKTKNQTPKTKLDRMPTKQETSNENIFIQIILFLFCALYPQQTTHGSDKPQQSYH